MKIENTNVNAPTPERPEQNRASGVTRPGGYGRTGESANPEPDGLGDQIDLSGLSRALRSQLADSPERSAYVDRLAELYKSGGYKPDTEEVGRRIVEDALKP